MTGDESPLVQALLRAALEHYDGGEDNTSSPRMAEEWVGTEEDDR